MKLIEHLKSVDILSFPCKFAGMKKAVWYDSEGKKYGLITFGKKNTVIVPLEDPKWDNIFQVELTNKCKNGTVSVDSGDILVWLKNNYFEDLRILEYGLLSKYFYIDNPKVNWMFPSSFEGQEEFVKLSQKHQLQVPMQMVYRNRDAGFLVLVLGNWYFLPKGESLTYYQPGIWSSKYGSAIVKTAHYLEGTSTLLLEKLPKVQSLPKLQMVIYILERLLVHELNFIFAKGLKRNKRTLNVRNRAVLSYSYFLYMLYPIYKNLSRFVCTGKKLGLSENTLNNILEKNYQKGTIKKYSERMRLHSSYSFCKTNLSLVRNFKGIKFLFLYLSILNLIYKREIDNTGVAGVHLNRQVSLKVAFSKIEQLNKRKLISVSRRSLNYKRPIV